MREAELEKAQRSKAEAERTQSDQKSPGDTLQQAETAVQPLSAPGDGSQGASASGGRVAHLPRQHVLPSGTARMADGATPADSGTSEAPSNTTTPEPEGSGTTVGTAVGASAGALAALSSLCAAAVLWRRRSRGSD